MAILKYGSSGEEVKKLQNALNAKGYKLSADGRYGVKTQAAVKDYQLKNKLKTDGIAGNETQSSLFGTTKAANAEKDVISITGLSENTINNLKRLQGGYIPSKSVTEALANYNKLKGEKDPVFDSPYTKKLEELYEKLTNRDPFKYDINSDALYSQYKDSYVRTGRRAMEDTMGQTAALTGGYGSSYSQTAGQQQYDSHLQQLNNVIPELYNMAYQRYGAEGEELYNSYAAAGEGYRRDYEQYRDKADAREKALNAAYQKYLDQLEMDRDAYDSQLQYWMNAAKLENADYWDTLSYIKSSSKGGGSGGSSGSKSSKKKKTITSDGTDGGKAYADRMDAYSTGRLASRYKYTPKNQEDLTVSTNQSFLRKFLENLGVLY